MTQTATKPSKQGLKDIDEDFTISFSRIPTVLAEICFLQDIQVHIAASTSHALAALNENHIRTNFSPPLTTARMQIE